MSPLMNTRKTPWQWQQPAKVQSSALHTSQIAGVFGCLVCVVPHFLGGYALPAPGELMDGQP